MVSSGCVSLIQNESPFFLTLPTSKTLERSIEFQPVFTPAFAWPMPVEPSPPNASTMSRPEKKRAQALARPVADCLNYLELTLPTRVATAG